MKFFIFLELILFFCLNMFTFIHCESNMGFYILLMFTFDRTSQLFQSGGCRRNLKRRLNAACGFNRWFFSFRLNQLTRPPSSVKVWPGKPSSPPHAVLLHALWVLQQRHLLNVSISSLPDEHQVETPVVKTDFYSWRNQTWGCGNVWSVNCFPSHYTQKGSGVLGVGWRHGILSRPELPFLLPAFIRLSHTHKACND